MDPRHAELIRKYLDRSASAAEVQELEKLLGERPDLADALACTARFDAMLGKLFQEEGARSKTLRLVEPIERARRSKWRKAGLVAAAAAVLLVGGAALLGLFQGKPLPLPTGTGPVATGPNRVISGQVLINGAAAESIPDGTPLRIADAQPAVIRLPDGSEAKLDPASRAVIHGQVPGLRQMVELVEGGGTFQVEKGNGEFQVETRLGRVTVLGTQFSVRLLPGDAAQPQGRMAVAVLSGLVQVEFAGRTYLLSANENRVFAGVGEGKRGPVEVRGTITAISPASISVNSGGERERNKEQSYPLANDVNVLIDNRRAKLADLAKGTLVFLQRLEGSDAVVGIRAEGPSVGGDVRAVDARSITLAGRRTEAKPLPDQVYPVSPDVQVLVDGKPGKVSDIRPGSRVALKLSVDQKTVVAITSGARREGREK